MHNSICRWGTVFLLVGTAVGQQKPDKQLKVLTVCEILDNLDRYAGTDVVSVGREERNVSLIDQYSFLSQDGCEHPVVTHGHKWSNKIQIWTDWEDGMPKPPADRPALIRSILKTKLSIVQKTTTLGVAEVPYFIGKGNSIRHNGERTVPNRWVAVYGRLVKVANLNKDCGADGCGGDDVPLVIVSMPHNVFTLLNDGRPVPDEE